ncbi:MAG: cation-transporting P-type ATPase [Opitutales bacterium]|nr:cation-transporting P-type ATPase [Opitutales bacterium]
MSIDDRKKEESANPWHALKVEEVFSRIESSDKGLSGEEVQKRIETHGRNTLPEAKGDPWWKRLLLQFHNILIYILIVAAVITALLQHWVDAWVIAAVVVINALIGFIQEGKAEKALASIRNLLSLEATVTRDGKKQSVPADELVPGDIVHLESGDKVPADIRLIKVRSLGVEEAALTGESVPVEKNPDPTEEKIPLGDRGSMAYSGTLITQGRGTGVVVATGTHTEIGKINEMMAEAPKMTTPLLRQITRFGHALTVVILALAALTYIFGTFVRGYDTQEVFFAVIGLAVAAIPEGLPAILTITLAIGVQAMAKRKAIIRKLPAVETLGSVSVICSDKTGTLTKGEMTVTHVATMDHLYEVSGTGYEPKGKISSQVDDIEADGEKVLGWMIRGGVLCNDSRLKEKDGQWMVEGNPTEGALMTLGGKSKLEQDKCEEEYPRISSVPFESQHKYMATLHRQPENDKRIVFLKGAPERVLERCSEQFGEDGSGEVDQEHWKKAMDHLAKRGERLLALAMKEVDGTTENIEHDDVREGFTFMGLFGIIDPPREEALLAIKACHEAGVRVKMITGDHSLTASAIGEQVGLKSEGESITGEELEEMDDEKLAEVADRVDVFARTSPEHKLRLVKALQSKGHIVAMTGDGVNDAPALKSADVGVAMGIKGTEAAKEASEMVLADDNFSSIENAVEEGRQVYDNIKKSILFILPTNGGQSLVIVAAILAGLVLPLTPVQILWVNMITAVTLALSLVFEPAEENLMKRPPRDPGESILPVFFLWRIAFVSVLIMMGSLGMFLWQSLIVEASDEVARTAAVNTLIFGQIFYLLNSRFIYASSLRWNVLTANPYVLFSISSIVMAQMVFTYTPLFNSWFGTAPYSAVAWVPILVIGMVVFLAVEIEKSVMRNFFGKK